MSPFQFASSLHWQFGDYRSNQSILFLLGGPRSGTTLLKQILGAVPEICSIEPESSSFFLVRPKAWHRKRVADHLEPEEVDRVFETARCTAEALGNLAAERTQRTGARYFLDKLNTVTFRKPLFYVHSFPNACFIFIIRDPRDAVASSRSHVHLKTQSVRKMARTWNDFEQFAQRLKRLRPVLNIRYEDLTSNPLLTLRKITDHLQIPFDASILNPKSFSPAPSMSATEGFWRLQEPISPKSVGRFTERLSGDEIRQIKRICGPGMKRWGYST